MTRGAMAGYPRVALRRFVIEMADGPFGSSLTSSHYSDQGARVVRLGNIGSARFKETDAAFIPLGYFAELRRHEVKAGDLLIAGLGDDNHPVGRACVAPKDIGPAIVKADCFRVRLDESRLTHRYAAWALSSSVVSGLVSTLARGSTRARINLEMAREIVLPVPKLEEQRRIADFLDAEVGKIESLVVKKRELLALLEERIDSRILGHIGASELVKAGEGLPARPIRRLLSRVNRPAAPTEEVITAFRDGQVTARSLRRAEGYTLTSGTEAQGQYVEVDDVVIHGLDGFAGAIGMSEAAGNCSPVYHVCIPRDGGDPAFYGRLLRVLAVSGYLGLFATSTRERAVDFRSWDLFGAIPIPSVSADEQFEIGAWVRSVRPLRVRVEQTNALAAERRQALITAAVTGQFDVSTASGRGIEE